ncbi:MAG: PAS domain-containing protein [Campylobacterota bacterium]|nr:PAS domain-containing protein [Campylobacterota bacterium]
MQIEMNADDFIVSKTDLKGRITYGNEIFIKMSGYSEKELLNAPHNILRHGDMPAVVFKLLWERLKEKSFINAYVKNRCKNGDYYWVFANVTTSLDERGNALGYYSVRRKPKASALQVIEGLYSDLLRAEKSGGISASQKLLEDTLKKGGVSYDEFIISLQK